jgi:hypothetical protein
VLELSIFRSHGISLECLINRHVANIAIIPNDLTFPALMTSIMTSEASFGIEMTNIVDVSPPISLHFREKIGFINSLKFLNILAYRIFF